jgi:dihydroorotase
VAYDLILKGGRILDPAQGIDAITDIGFADGKVAAIEQGLKPGSGTLVRDVTGQLVVPGLIDLHTHVYWGGTSLGVDAEGQARRSAVTTLVDAGSTGPGNFAGFRKHVIERSACRILAYLHVSFAGIFGFSRRIFVGESEEQRLLAPLDAIEVADANRDIVVGLKVRVGRYASGRSGLVPLDIARQAAEQLKLPMMVHIDEPPPTIEDVLARLRPGDVLTHAFRPFPNTPVTVDGTVKPEVLAARERGVLFDIGHGMGSLSFANARAMLANGFLPDCISSDVHALCEDGPVFDLLTTLSKFLCIGMPLDAVIGAATAQPAHALRRPELGSLAAGNPGDASILDLREGRFSYVDSVGETLAGDQRMMAAGVVIGGRWWHPS